MLLPSCTAPRRTGVCGLSAYTVLLLREDVLETKGAMEPRPPFTLCVFALYGVVLRARVQKGGWDSRAGAAVVLYLSMQFVLQFSGARARPLGQRRARCKRLTCNLAKKESHVEALAPVTDSKVTSE